MKTQIVLEEDYGMDKNSYKMIDTYLKGLGLIEEQVVDLTDYHKFLSSGTERSLKIHSIADCLAIVYYFGRFTKKPYHDIKKEDFINYFYDLVRTRRLKPISIDNHKAKIKKFYKWMYQTEDYPDIVKWIKLTNPKVRKTEEEMLTIEEVKKLINAMETPRDKALIAVTFDGALRKAEALNIRLSDLMVDEYGIKVNVDGKTGKRTVRLIYSVPYIQDLINNHREKDNKNAYIFMNARGINKRLLGAGIDRVLKIAMRRTSIGKRVHPHLLRHSRLNQLAKEGFNERDLRIFAGWSNESKMPDTYLHYDQDAVDKKLLENNGFITDKKKAEIQRQREILKPKKCPRCEKINPADAKYCNCGMALDLKTVMEDTKTREEYDDKMNGMFKDPKFIEMFQGYMKSKQGESK